MDDELRAALARVAGQLAAILERLGATPPLALSAPSTPPLIALQPRPPKQTSLLPTEPPVLTFPCTGAETSWALSQAVFKQWEDIYPAVDVLANLKVARGWLMEDLRNLKTSRGMLTFLGGWLRRNINDRKAIMKPVANGRPMRTAPAVAVPDAWAAKYGKP